MFNVKLNSKSKIHFSFKIINNERNKENEISNNCINHKKCIDLERIVLWMPNLDIWKILSSRQIGPRPQFLYGGQTKWWKDQISFYYHDLCHCLRVNIQNVYFKVQIDTFADCTILIALNCECYCLVFQYVVQSAIK